MTINYGFKRDGFALACDPLRMADGRFGAQVTVYTEEGIETVARRFPALGYFQSEEDAVGHALVVGEGLIAEFRRTGEWPKPR